MDVVLPSTGCNIINNATSFYNYSPDYRTRQTYVIYDGKAILQATNTAINPYNVTGTCLVTGDLVYKPEYKEFLFPLTSLLSFLLILCFVYKIFIKRLLP